MTARRPDAVWTAQEKQNARQFHDPFPGADDALAM
jgi:hypothetical protein